MNKPDLTAVATYLGDDALWNTEEVSAALLAEEAAQSSVCRVPSTPEDWPADLAEALCRRVAANLARRNLPLGLNVAMGEATVQTTRVGTDQEVRRLEAPWRRLVVG
ncbi:hypothetical protein [Kribbella sp. DT2]|uniref:hypothetical protein n=1 Tax=Kribbella sp. DT2 TaxID=3393427 RepID=UPI003CED9B0F